MAVDSHYPVLASLGLSVPLVAVLKSLMGCCLVGCSFILLGRKTSTHDSGIRQMQAEFLSKFASEKGVQADDERLQTKYHGQNTTVSFPCCRDDSTCKRSHRQRQQHIWVLETYCIGSKPTIMLQTGRNEEDSIAEIDMTYSPS